MTSLSKNKKELLADYYDVIKPHYADFLQELGFVSYRDDLVHWFLLREDLLIAFQFQTEDTSYTLSMTPVLTAYPLFLDTPISSALYNENNQSVPMHMSLIRKKDTYRNRLALFYPHGENFGADWVKRLLPVFVEQIRTARDAFELHKTAYQIMHPMMWIAPEFVDEVIYFNDEAMRPRVYQQTLKTYRNFLEDPAELSPFFAKRKAQVKARLDAFDDPRAREEYLAILEARKEAKRKELKRKIPAVFGNG